ncbi:MAG: hypothetical protein WBX25_36290 [Rhodomicrobium sp.]
MGWLRWGGILLGAISLFSLVQKLTSSEVAPIFDDMMRFYRAALYPLADLIIFALEWSLSLINLRLPTIPQDIVIIYILIGTTFFQSLLRCDQVILHQLDEIIRKHNLSGSKITKSGRIERVQPHYMLVVLAISLLAWPLAVLSRIRDQSTDYIVSSTVKELYVYRTRWLVDMTLPLWFLEISLLVATFLALFGINAYLTY